MPILRRITKERREYSPAHKEVLLTGNTHLFPLAAGFYRGAALNRVAVQAAWSEIKGAVAGGVDCRASGHATMGVVDF